MKQVILLLSIMPLAYLHGAQRVEEKWMNSNQRLIMAVWDNDHKRAQVALRAGACISPTLFYRAVDWSYRHSDYNPSLIRVLLEAKADPNECVGGMYPLHYICHEVWTRKKVITRKML